MQKFPHPLHAAMLAVTAALFLAVLLSDWAYYNTYEIQWKNFASWLLVGSLVFGGLTLLWSVMGISRAALRTTRQLIWVALLLALWVLGLINAFVHAGDAWASMPAALAVSMINAVLAMAATWLGLSGTHRRVAE